MQTDVLNDYMLDYVYVFSLGFAARRESVFFEPILNALVKFKMQKGEDEIPLNCNSSK
jgi:hypothetical protein